MIKDLGDIFTNLSSISDESKTFLRLFLISLQIRTLW